MLLFSSETFLILPLCTVLCQVEVGYQRISLQFPICACQGRASKEDKSLRCVVSNNSTEHPCLLLQPWERCSTPGCSWWGAVSWGRSEEKPGGPGAGQPSSWGNASRGSAICAGSSPGEGEGGRACAPGEAGCVSSSSSGVSEWHWKHVRCSSFS